MTITNVIDIAYVRISSNDLDTTDKFMQDFGMTVQRSVDQQGKTRLYSRGTNGAPYHHITEEGKPGFLGLAFEAETREALEALAKLPDASDIQAIDAPGGGEKVTFTDPNGYMVDVVFGREYGENATLMSRPPINTSDERPRLQQAVRFKQSKSQVKRLGHCILFVKNYRESEAWYKERFGFLTTDEIYAGVKENIIGAFIRCNRGSTPVDHHTIALMQAPDPSISGMQHAAFEVHDWDDLMIGHHFLKKNGYKPQWGVGKHFVGSQVFDYWYDTNGQVMEHFTDGDLFDASQPPKLEPMEVLLGAQWGPEPAEGDHPKPPSEAA